MKFSISKILKDSEEWNRADVLDINKQVNAQNSDKSWIVLMSKYKRKKRVRIYRYTAVLLLPVLSFAVFYLLNLANNDVTHLSAKDGLLEHMLPDSSIVWLRKGSSISYRNEYGSDSRVLFMEGTAFFEVERNELLPFVINSEKSAVEVLGTSFIYESGATNQVQVFTGVVKFSNNQKEFKILKKNERVILDEQNEFIEVAPDPNIISWKTKRLTFENTPLNEVVKALSEYYGVSLEADDSEQTEITATFDDISLEEVIEYIQIATGVEIRPVGS